MFRFFMLLPAACLLLSPISADDAKLKRGAAVYSHRCSECHGDRGEGSDNYPDPLFGDKPTVDLAEYISGAMPEGEP